MIEMRENGGREGNLNSAELETCRSMGVTVFTLKKPLFQMLVGCLVVA